MGILNRNEIKDRINREDYKRKLLITPLLKEDQIGPASVDVRLGCSIIIPRRTYVDSQDVTDPDIVERIEKRLYDRVRLKFGDKFVLHPNELILGVTFEYVALPFDVFATIASRSSWGRLGLVVATASAIQPGFKGCITLELANLGASPIVLYPGLLVGQLILYDVPSKGESSTYDGRYDCPTEPGLPLFFSKPSDHEMAFWGRKEPSQRQAAARDISRPGPT